MFWRGDASLVEQQALQALDRVAIARWFDLARFSNFFEAVTTRQAAFCCGDGVDRRRAHELLDAEIEAFNNLIATQSAAKPPLVALVGLLGIPIGEQVIPVGKQLLTGTSLAAACHDANCVPHVFGELPGRHTQPPADTAQLTQSRETRS
ncbi:MAG: hypothetical protein QOF70_7926 [Acetobacteraceae bacterium]|jgi:xanthosine utilization system XapX-like protein|nr:hypothetical protein [Rhodopila sp.]MEA2733451.1 hypothetical protein [Acetobacteraceae bacterium]